MAENPPYVFRDTTQDLIEQHHRRLTTFVGYSAPEVKVVRRHPIKASARLPSLWRKRSPDATDALARPKRPTHRNAWQRGLPRFHQPSLPRNGARKKIRRIFFPLTDQVLRARIR